ncbi:MAG: hypothetical protein Q8L27_00650 [archaeon]|nr:hypothetical protein [archaeon]
MIKKLGVRTAIYVLLNGENTMKNAKDEITINTQIFEQMLNLIYLYVDKEHLVELESMMDNRTTLLNNFLRNQKNL